MVEKKLQQKPGSTPLEMPKTVSLGTTAAE